MARKLSQRESQIIDRFVGVAETDSPLEKAKKGLKMMKLAGFPAREIAKAEKMIADAIARGVK